MEDNYKNKVTEIALIVSLLGYFISIISILINYRLDAYFYINQVNYLVIFFSTILLITRNQILGHYLQIITVVIALILTFIMDFSSVYVLYELIILFILLKNSIFYKSQVILKIMFIFLVMFEITLIFYLKNNLKLITIGPVIIFLSIFLILLVIDFESFKIKIRGEQELSAEIEDLNYILTKNDIFLEKLEIGFINPSNAGLSKAEILLLETLCVYRESNIDLAHRLNKSSNTIKVQMKSIFQKIGVENRYQLIDLCKNYFLWKHIP